MAVEVKVAPDERLEYKSVFLEDRRATSQYFNLTEVPDTFTGGKNAFLIAGTDYLEPNTEVLIQVRDSKGKIVYTESSDGAPTEYYEGISKVVAVYVYPTDSVEQAIDSTAFGPCTLTILGELKFYDNNGSKTEVPEIWKGKYNVRYITQINVNPNLANTTRVRFFRRPQATITELLKPIYSVSGSAITASAITASYANIKLSRLETFAGDVKRVKVYRTSEGTVSDFELIQDIQIEAKELLQTFNATGSVITDTGFFNSEVLLNFWNSGSLSAATLNTAHFSGSTGVKLEGAGNFKYTPYLDLSDVTVYELAFDAFYTGSSESNLEIHISGSQNGDLKVDTLVGLFPTKDFTNYVSQFTLPKSEPSASLYFKQTQSNWYLKDISLRASAETVFSPNEVSFVVSMPTNISNETFNFKFEFFDVNNNYIPVAVTGSKTFTGGNDNLTTIATTVTAISGAIDTFSGSYFEDVWSGSTSLSGSLTSSVSSSIGITLAASASLSSSISSSVSSSYSSSKYLAESSSNALSSSLSQSVHTVSSFLDERIFTNSSGSLIKPPKTGSAGLYTSNTHLGYHSGGTWKTYMSDNGSFYLTSSVVGGGFLAWDAADATLQIQGSINITGGNAATQTYASGAAFTSANGVSASLAPSIFTDSSGKIRRPPTITPATSGLYIGSTNMGYYNGSAWKTYMSDTGNFYLDGATGSLSWIADTDTLEINGVINVIGGNAATQTYANSAATTAASSSQAAAISQASAYVTQLANANWTAGDGTFISGRSISSPVIAADAGYISGLFKVGQNGITLDGTNKKIYIGSGSYANANTPFYFASGSAGQNLFSLGEKLSWNGSTLSISGDITVTGGNALKTGDAATDINNGSTPVNGGKITAGSIDAQQIRTLELTSQRVVFQTGSIGGWVINSQNIASKPDTNGRSRLVLTPSPEIRVNDVNGAGKLFIRSGPLTTPTNSSVSTTANFTSVTLPNTTSIDYQNIIDGGYQSFTVTSPGSYSGTISGGPYVSVAAMNDSSWTGYMYVGLSYQIASNTSFTALIADGVITSKGVGSYSENGSNTQLDLPSTTVGINLALAAGTYYSRLRWTVIYYSDAGSITVSPVDSGTKASSLALTNTLAELTDEGLQLIYNADTYFRIERGALQGSSSDAYVKIGGKLEVTGDIVSLASDKRLKENIIPIDGALNKINKLNGVYFNYTDKAKEANPHFADGRQVGLIAQEIQEVLPEVVNFAPFDYGVNNQNISGENYLTLNYDKVVPLLLQAIKELKCELDEVKKLIK
jgi:hypothetical protein